MVLSLVAAALVLLLWTLLYSDIGRPLRVIAVDRLPMMREVESSIRHRLLLEDPQLLAAVSRGGSFGGEYSRLVATDIFGDSPEAVADVRAKTELIEVAPRSWLIRFPIVNAAVFETDEGLVVVDTGMAAAGPALLDSLRKISDKPVHTVIYTHGHVDHAYGLKPMLAAGENPQIIAHAALPDRFRRYLLLRGSMARYMSQPEESLPATAEDLVWPTRTFHDRLELMIGGERFVLQHHRGETDDQLYVWAADRRALASADYYQGFLPNAGNGKRVQRYPGDWAVALREMAALDAAHLLPGHGAPISNDPEQIAEQLNLLAAALEHVVDHVISGLNRGLRKYEIVLSTSLPPELAERHSLREQYVSVQDIAKMVIRRHTGWWDDIPSHWTPASPAAQATELAALAGGAKRLATRSLELIDSDLRLAAQLADWAWFADPDDPLVQQVVMEVYRQRILAPESNTQEILVYLDAMAEVRLRQLERGGREEESGRLPLKQTQP